MTEDDTSTSRFTKRVVNATNSTSSSLELNMSEQCAIETAMTEQCEPKIPFILIEEIDQHIIINTAVRYGLFLCVLHNLLLLLCSSRLKNCDNFFFFVEFVMKQNDKRTMAHEGNRVKVNNNKIVLLDYSHSLHINVLFDLLR